MNISSGISEISVYNKSGNIGKVYTWPKINQGKVKPIDKVSRRPQNSHYLHKPTDEEKVKLLEKIKTEKFGSYTQQGKKSFFSETVAPGSFFDALA